MKLFGKPKQYPYYVKFKDGRVSGTFRTKKEAQALMKSLTGGAGRIIKRRSR